MAEGPSTSAPSAPLLQTDQAARKLWLVKVPNIVAQHWQAVCDKAMNDDVEPVGPRLGVIKYSTDDKGQAQFDLQLDNPATAGLPQEYRLNVMTEGMADMLAFSSNAGRTAAEGRVHHKFDLEAARRPARLDGKGGVTIDPEYRKLSRERFKAAATKTRTVRAIDTREAANIRQPLVLRQKRKVVLDKRVAAPKEELTADLFRLFERQAQWSFAELQRATEQPTQHLKTVLGEIARQDKTGPYKDLWHLKEGYAVKRTAAATPHAPS